MVSWALRWYPGYRAKTAGQVGVVRDPSPSHHAGAAVPVAFGRRGVTPRPPLAVYTMRAQVGGTAGPNGRVPSHTDGRHRLQFRILRRRILSTSTSTPCQHVGGSEWTSSPSHACVPVVGSLTGKSGRFCNCSVVAAPHRFSTAEPPPRRGVRAVPRLRSSLDLNRQGSAII